MILCGIETQACIHHTTLDLLDQGFEVLTGRLSAEKDTRYAQVHIPVDCASSRSMVDRRVALERLQQVSHHTSCNGRGGGGEDLKTILNIWEYWFLQVGAFLTTSECVILGLAPDSAHPKFKGLQKLVMELARDSGL